MAQPQTSFGGSFGMGEESTYGTAVSITNWLEMISCTLDREIDYQPEGTLGRSGDAGRMNRRKYVASDNVSGSISFNMAYDDSTLMVFKHAMGVVATTGTATPYAHAISLGALPTGLSIEKHANASKAEKFEGCKITDFTVNIAAGGLMTCDATFIGETSGGLVAAGTPTYSTSTEEIKHHHAGQLSFNAVNYDITDLTISASSGVDRRQVLGSKLTKEPTPAGKREVTFSVTYEWLADTLHAAFIAGTESDVAITFTGSGDNTLIITGHNAYVSSVSTPIQGPGVISQTVEFTCQSDGTDLGLKFAFTNANATSTTN